MLFNIISEIIYGGTCWQILLVTLLEIVRFFKIILYIYSKHSSNYFLYRFFNCKNTVLFAFPNSKTLLSENWKLYKHFLRMLCRQHLVTRSFTISLILIAIPKLLIHMPSLKRNNFCLEKKVYTISKN